ncbi:gcn5-related N-acetyltransferase [Gonapodya prolifera JEL478]|uniref:Gcn5-related N-acetyltransferase n=1 Tax=Gonapodya prolifera (strain JEL478) TaxID=1344416 RepID=A0A139A5K1_GONPJ|nr:gcn5-related N-acetyltransferase [Gonapodya prolifera JEL478]|eukprot:KXS11745.1 gcn5-related N-acetyltransferase [Gonapodya prolifera JEL478]
MPVTIQLERPDTPDVAALLSELDDYLIPLAPPEFQFRLDVQTLIDKKVIFAVARDETGTAVSCGGVLVTPDYAEIKRMWTSPSHRGRGYARTMLAFLEKQAIDRGAKRLTVETGTDGVMDSALGLYRSVGFKACKPFGEYEETEHNSYLEKWV